MRKRSMITDASLYCCFQIVPRQCAVVLGIAFLLLPAAFPSFAQEQFLQVTGRNHVKVQLSHKQNPYQEIRPFYWEWEFEPILQIGKFPLAFYVLISSEQQEFRQNINAVTGLFSPENMEKQLVKRMVALREKFEQDPEIRFLAERYDAVRDSLATYDPERLAMVEQYRKLQDLQNFSGEKLLDQSAVLSELGLLSSFERVLMHLPQIEIGTVYPQFLNSLALSGVAVNGVGVHWAPGNVRTAFTYGATRKPIVSNDSTVPSVFGQQLYGVQIGWQTSSQNFFSLALVSGKDDISTLSDTLRVDNQLPQATNVVSLRFSQDFFHSHFQLNGEAAVSLSTWDLRSPYIEDSPFPEWMVKRLSLRTSSFWDYAYKAEALLSVPSINHRISFQTTTVGPGYYSLGNPSLRRDYRSYGVRLQQQLVQRRIAVVAFYNQEQDNLLRTKNATTETIRWMGQLSIRFPRFPFFTAMVNQVQQQFDTTRNRTTLWRVQSSYAYPIGAVSNVTAVSYGQQLYEYTTRSLLHNFTVLHILNFRFPLQLNSQLLLLVPDASVDDTVSKRIFQVSFQGQYAVTQNFLIAAGIGYGKEAAVENYNVQVDLQYNFGKLGTVFLSAVARPFSAPSYSEYFVQLRLEQRWE